MVNRRVCTAMIYFVLLDDNEVKTRGKTRSWIKRRKQRDAFSMNYAGYCQFQPNAANGL